MLYLIRKVKNAKSNQRVAHIWNSAKHDTMCKMVNSLGLRLGNYELQDFNKEPDKICLMCQSVISKY